VADNFYGNLEKAKIHYEMFPKQFSYSQPGHGQQINLQLAGQPGGKYMYAWSTISTSLSTRRTLLSSGGASTYTISCGSPATREIIMLRADQAFGRALVNRSLFLKSGQYKRAGNHPPLFINFYFFDNASGAADETSL